MYIILVYESMYIIILYTAVILCGILPTFNKFLQDLVVEALPFNWYKYFAHSPIMCFSIGQGA